MTCLSFASGVRAVSVAALLVTACGSSVTAVQLDGGTADVAATVDAPVVLGTCRRATSGPLVVVSDPSDPQRFQLVDAIATPDGALVAWRERDPANGPDRVHVRRVRDDGSVHPWSAPGRMSRGAVVSLPRMADLQFSMAWDAARDAAVMLAAGQTDRGACAFVTFRGDGSQLAQTVELNTLGGFSLSGCGSIARTDDGWSFLTSEVRALWGDQLVFLSEDGRFAGMPTRLPMTEAPTSGPMTRTVVSGGFVATWVEARTIMPGAEVALYAQRFDRRGTALGDAVVLDRGEGAYSPARVLETGDGLLATWHRQAITVRALRADVSPAGESVTLARTVPAAGVHADVRGDEVLAVMHTAVFDPSATRLFLVVTDGRGTPLAEPIRLLPDTPLSFVEETRVVPTRRGALVVFGQGQRVYAVPVDCLP